MADMLSPGVYLEEVDASQIVSAASSNVACFAGNFKKGSVGEYNTVNSVADLIDIFGYPDNTNYNDWYQCYNFLQYGNKLLVSRAANINGSKTYVKNSDVVQIITEQVRTQTAVEVDNAEASELEVTDSGEVVTTHNKIQLENVANLAVGNIISIGKSDERYMVVAIDSDSKTITLDRDVPSDSDEQPKRGDEVYLIHMVFNGSVEAVDEKEVENKSITDSFDNIVTTKVPNVLSKDSQFDFNPQISNFSEFDEKLPSIGFSDPAKAKLKFMSRNPGTWCEDLRICIAKPSSFAANSADPQFTPHYAFEGIVVDDLFEYAPKDEEVGIIVYDNVNEKVLETFTVSFDEDAKDYNNKSIFIETVINRKSSYIYCKVNSSNKDPVADYTLVYDTSTKKYVGTTLKLVNASDSDIQKDDLLDAYEVFSNSEELDLDIVIANELDAGESAKNLVQTRQDCIAFIGCSYDDVVAQKSTVCVNNLVTWRKSVINFNNMFCVACGNYKYQYDRYNDKYRWVNIAGDIAGLRAETSTNHASWWASAGLERGQLSNVVKLAFNPTKAQRDTLYKNAINPIVTFPGQGTVCWGQKTLLDKESSFSRVNVRGLFNTLERSLKKMSRYQIMEFNDSFTRNRIVSMIKPFLSSVKAGRGIQEFLVVCDETNNTPQVIAQNQLIVDVYIKPTYVAEFILLRFTNAGVNDFSEIIQGA